MRAALFTVKSPSTASFGDAPGSVLFRSGKHLTRKWPIISSSFACPCYWVKYCIKKGYSLQNSFPIINLAWDLERKNKEVAPFFGVYSVVFHSLIQGYVLIMLMNY